MGKCKLGGIISTHTPLAGRDKPLFFVKNGFWHISTHTPLAGRDQPVQLRLHIVRISTHTPLAGRDTANLQALGLEQDFYSHAPRGFLLTRPSRGATGLMAQKDVTYHFYSHAPRGARLRSAACRGIIEDFYSHAPRGARQILAFSSLLSISFLLTRPSRGATRDDGYAGYIHYISTHTPLAGRDENAASKVSGTIDFYSHAPRGARPKSWQQLPASQNFYSHAPRGARQEKS